MAVQANRSLKSLLEKYFRFHPSRFLLCSPLSGLAQRMARQARDLGNLQSTRAEMRRASDHVPVEGAYDAAAMLHVAAHYLRAGEAAALHEIDPAITARLYGDSNVAELAPNELGWPNTPSYYYLGPQWQLEFTPSWRVDGCYAHYESTCAEGYLLVTCAPRDATGYRCGRLGPEPFVFARFPLFEQTAPAFRLALARLAAPVPEIVERAIRLGFSAVVRGEHPTKALMKASDRVFAGADDEGDDELETEVEVEEDFPPVGGAFASDVAAATPLDATEAARDEHDPGAPAEPMRPAEDAL